MCDNNSSNIAVRQLRETDAETISAAFREQGWEKPAEQYLRYWEEQARGERVSWIAEAGYIPDGNVIYWNDAYVRYGEQVVADDDLNLFLVKMLR